MCERHGGSLRDVGSLSQPSVICQRGWRSKSLVACRSRRQNVEVVGRV